MQAAPGADRKIALIVDDEPLIRMMVATEFEDRGFDVLEAGNAQEALKLLDDQRDIRVLFSDIQMPGQMDGLGLAHLVRRKWSHVAIILSSGRTLPPKTTLPLGARFLAKPVEAAMIKLILNELVG